MTDQITVEVLDGGAEPDAGRTRAEVLGLALVAGSAVLAGGVLIAGLPVLADSEPSREQDTEILNLALVIERLQSAFYAEALQRGRLTGEARQFAGVVGGHERAHLDFIAGALGKAARPAPKFDFGDATRDPAKFLAAAVALEDTGLAAYNGQATSLTPRALASAARIVSVEARHAAWIRDLAGKTPAPQASDAAIGAKQAKAAFARQGLLDPAAAGGTP